MDERCRIRPSLDSDCGLLPGLGGASPAASDVQLSTSIVDPTVLSLNYGYCIRKMMPGKRDWPGLAQTPKKQRKSASTVEDITFDFGAREDYLLGFHKRKLQRIKRAREEAEKKDREEKVTARKLVSRSLRKKQSVPANLTWSKLRDGRKADLEKHVEAVNAMLRKADVPLDELNNDADEAKADKWEGNAEVPDVDRIDREAEYEDENRHTTVTIEAVDVTKEGLKKVNDVNNTDDALKSGTNAVGGEVSSAIGCTSIKVKRIWTEKRPEGLKKKKKKFRYESKAERKITRFKERSGNKAKAKARKE